MAHSRLSPRTLIVAAMLVSGSLAAPAFAPALAQRPPAGQPAGTALNKQMVPLYNDAIKSMQASDWAGAKPKLDAAYAAAKTPQEKLLVEQQRLRVATELKDNAGMLAAVKASIATGAMDPELLKRFKQALGAAYAGAGDAANASAANRAYVDEYGGTAGEYGAIATDARKAGDWATADKYVQKAMEAAKAANASAADIEKYLAFQVHTYWDAKAYDKYTSGMATIIAAYPGKDDYWRELVARAQAEPGYAAAQKDILLDVYRVMLATFKLTPAEKGTMASAALSRDLPNEALNILKPLIDKGELGGASDTRADQNKKNFADAERKTKLEETGLAKEEKDSAAKGDATYMAQVGEVLLTHAEYARAVMLLKSALDKGVADAGKADIVRLHLGIAQFKAGDKAAAKATLASIKSDNGATGLARIWTILADMG
jgi:hypothetical protein